MVLTMSNSFLRFASIYHLTTIWDQETYYPNSLKFPSGTPGLSQYQRYDTIPFYMDSDTAPGTALTTYYRL